MINLVFIVMVAVVLVLVPPTSPPRKFILEQTVMMGGFGHLRVIIQHITWHHHSVRIIQLNMMMVTHLRLHLLL